MLNSTPNDLPTPSISDTPKIEEGTYPAVITALIDLGVQKDKKFDSWNKADEDCTEKDYEISHKFWFTYSLPTERYETEDDEGEIKVLEPVLGKKEKVSNYDRSNLQKMYKAILKGKGTYADFLGKTVTVQIGKTSGGNPKIVSVGAPTKGMVVDVPLRENLLVSDEMWEDLDDLDIPDFIKDMIERRIR